MRRAVILVAVWVAVGGAISGAGKVPPGYGLDVPYVRQEKDGCGAAAISMLLQYWGKQRAAPNAVPTAAAIMRQLYSKEAGGIRAADMEAFFQEIGFQSFAFRGEWEDVEHHLAKGRPLIVSLKEGAVRSSFHYVVVTGVSPDKRAVLLNDPERGQQFEMKRTTFEKRWNGVTNWTLLALPGA